MKIRRPVEAGDGLRIGIAGNAGRKIAEIAPQCGKSVDLHCNNSAFAVESHASDGIVIARLRIGEEALGSCGRPLDRPAQDLSSPNDRRHFGREVSLDAEPSADVGRDHPDLMLGNVQRVDREPAAQVMRLLNGRIERVAVVGRVIVAKVGAGLDRVGRQPIVLEVERYDLRSRRHCRLGLGTISALDLEHEIGTELLVHQRRARRNGIPRGGDCGQRIIVYLHRLGGIFRGKPALGQDRGDDIADVMDFFTCKGRARSAVHRPAVAERHRMHDRKLAMPCIGPILRGQRQQHAGASGCRLGRNRSNAGVRLRASHESAPCRAGQDHIIDKAALSPEQAAILTAPERLADVAGALLDPLGCHPPDVHPHAPSRCQ